MQLIDEYKNAISGGLDGFITTFNVDGTNIIYSTYLGGDDYDDIYSFVLGPDSEVYVVGDTASVNFPTNNALISNLLTIGNYDSFFTKLSKDYIIPKLSVRPSYNFTVGTKGHNISFVAADNDPQAYYEIYNNGTLTNTSVLKNENITFSVDYLELGSYHFVISVQDRSGNKIEQNILIMVVDPSKTSNTSNNGNSLDGIIVKGILMLGLFIILGGFAFWKFNEENNFLEKWKNFYSANKNNPNIENKEVLANSNLDDIDENIVPQETSDNLKDTVKDNESNE